MRCGRLMRAAAVVVIGLCGAVGAAGCGGGSDSGSGSTTTAAASSGRFCALGSTIQDRVNRLLGGEGLTNPVQLRRLVTEVASAINQAVEVAPGEIKPELQSVAKAADKFSSALKSANDDPQKVSPDATAKLQEAVNGPGAKVQAYFKAHCTAG